MWYSLLAGFDGGALALSMNMCFCRCFLFFFGKLTLTLEQCSSVEGGIALPETNIAPENGWFPFGMAYFQGLC